MYAQYLKEREGLELLETEYGFATYKIRPWDCYIQDIYVLPEFRKSGVAAGIADTIALLAKAQGIKMLVGSVDQRAPSADTSSKVLLGYGMRPYSKEGHMTYYCKEIT